MIERLFDRLSSLLKSLLAREDGARTLQIAGFVRFTLIFTQGAVLVKAGVPLEIISQIEFVFFVVNFFMFYWQTGGKNALLTWSPNLVVQQRLDVVVAAMHLFGLIAALVFVGTTLSGVYGSIGDFLNPGQTLVLSTYVLFSIPAVPQIYMYLLTGRRRHILWYVLVTYTLQVVAVVVPTVLGYPLEIMLWSLAIFAFCRWLFVLFDGRWFDAGLPAWSKVWTYLVFALPLVLHALNGGLMDYIDGWIVSWRFDPEMFALYRYGAKEFPANALVIGGLITGLLPVFQKQSAVEHNVLKQEIRRLIRSLAPINCLLILLSPLLFELAYSSEFRLSARIFNIYALTLITRLVINQVYLYVFRHTWVLALSTAVEVVVNVALSLWLIQLIGILGIPLATVITYGLHKMFLAIYIRTQMKTPVAVYLPMRSFALAALGLILAFLTTELIYFEWPF